MNVHGTHASIDLTDKVGAHAKPSKTGNDCQIQHAEFAHMLTRLIDKPAEPSADGIGAADGPATSTVTPGR
jgi:hypothetical protein